jgi:hypothetical protein
MLQSCVAAGSSSMQKHTSLGSVVEVYTTANKAWACYIVNTMQGTPVACAGGPTLVKHLTMQGTPGIHDQLVCLQRNSALNRRCMGGSHPTIGEATPANT